MRRFAAIAARDAAKRATASGHHRHAAAAGAAEMGLDYAATAAAVRAVGKKRPGAGGARSRISGGVSRRTAQRRSDAEVRRGFGGRHHARS